MASTPTTPTTPTGPTGPTGPPPEVPEPRGVAAVWAFPATIALWTWVVGWLPRMVTTLAARDDYDGWWGSPPPELYAAHADDLPRWSMAFGGLLVAGIGFVIAGQWDRYGLAGWFRALSVAVGIGIGGWLFAAAYSSPLRLAPHLAGLAVVLGAAWWALDAIHDRRAAHPTASPTAPAAPVPDSEELRVMNRALAKSNNADVIIVEFDKTAAGQSWTLGPRTHDPVTGEPLDELPDFADFSSRLPRLRTHLQVHWRRHGVEFAENDIRAEAGVVDRWFLHLNTLHPETANIDASERPAGRRSWNDPVWIGKYMTDMAAMALRMHAVHMKILGKSEGGKSTIANNILRGAVSTVDLSTGRRDCVVFVFATDKLAPFTFPWLRPFLDGTMGHPVIDWAAGDDPYEVLRGFRAVYYLARARNRDLAEDDKLPASSDRPGVIVFWEEAKHGGNRPETIEVDGQEWGISRLVMEIMGMSRSAGIGIVPLTQDGTYDGIGPYGGDCHRNFAAFACTRTTNHADTILNLTGLVGTGVDTTKLEHNTIYLQPNTGDEARALPGKCANVRTEPIIAPLVLAESAPLGPAVFPADDVAAMGEDYTGRWRADRNPVLTRVSAKRGWPWREYGVPDDAPQTEANPPARTSAAAPRVDDPIETALHLLAGAAGEDGAALVAMYRAGELDDSIVGMARALLDGPGAEVPLPPEVAGAVPPGPVPPAAAVNETGQGWTDADDAAFAAFLAGDTPPPPPAVPPAVFTPPGEVPPAAEPVSEAAGEFGLCSERDMANLEELARQATAWVDARAAAAQADDAAAVATGPADLPSPVAEVVAAVASLRMDRPTLAWVATAELAARVYPADAAADEVAATTKLGKEISLKLPWLERTPAKFYGPGNSKRGRGYDVAALEAAVAAYRGGRRK